MGTDLASRRNTRNIIADDRGGHPLGAGRSFDVSRAVSALPSLDAARLRSLATGNTANLVATGFALAALRLLGSLLLTRMLPTDAFGTIAIVSSVAVTFGLLSDLGIAAFVVRHEGDLTREFLDEVWTIRLIYCAFLTLLTAAAGFPVAYALAKPELALPIAMGGLIFIFSALDSLAFASMLRRHRVKRLNLIEIATQLATLAASVGIAVAFRNFWALIVGGFVGQLVRAALTYVVFEDQNRRWAFSKSRVQELWKFSRYISASTFLTLLVTQADKFILGRTMNLGALGLYNIALNITSVPLGFANQFAEKILFPRVSDAVRTKSANVSAAFYGNLSVSVLMVSVAALTAGAADLVIRILYPAKIDGAAVFLRIVMVGIVFAINNSRINHLMIALGRTSFTFTTNLVRCSALIVGVVVGFYTVGVIGVIWAFSLIEVAAQIYGWWQLYKVGIIRVKFELAILSIALMSYGFAVILARVGYFAIEAVLGGRWL